MDASTSPENVAGPVAPGLAELPTRAEGRGPPRRALPVPREISSGFKASAELRPIDRRRWRYPPNSHRLGKPIELLRRLEEPPLTFE